MASTSELAKYLDDYLRVREIGDWPNALNGLQLENSGRVEKIGAAVDVSSRVLAEASERGITFLVVHHGLFWPGLRPIVGPFRKQIAIAFEHDVAIYSAHLPLDLHPIVGNNALVAASLGLTETEPFFEAKGQLVGLKATLAISREDLIRRLKNSLGGEVKAFSHGPATTGSIGIITGAAADEIYSIAKDGIDTFITGEAPHWAAVAAEELGMNLLLGGHYATETFGVKAVAAHLSETFKVPWEFIDAPTSL